MSAHPALGRGPLKVVSRSPARLPSPLARWAAAGGCRQQEKDQFLGAPTSPVESQPLGGPAASGDQIGSGPTRVGLIVRSHRALGRASSVPRCATPPNWRWRKSGCERHHPARQGRPFDARGARAAAQAALGEGAELLIGPLFAPDVRETGRVARPAGKPVIAFSTDTSAATRGRLSSVVPGRMLCRPDHRFRRLAAAKDRSPRSFRRTIMATSPWRSSSRSPRSAVCA